jgi:NCAIR mutase (PurE)-related protein
MTSIDHIGEIAKLDLDRQERAGVPEVVFGQGKSFDQVVALSRALAEQRGRAMATRLDPAWLDLVVDALKPLNVEVVHRARAIVVSRRDAVVAQSGGKIGLLTAGTSDIAVAEEARLVAQEMGCQVFQHYDVGVAGIHRLLEPLGQFKREGVAAVVAVAGMDGALPTLVKSLIVVPVIGVPTSVGYGLGRPGEAALMTMLHSCVPGLTVVNIDNGFGGGATAALIANQLARGAVASSDGPVPEHRLGSSGKPTQRG